MHKKIWFQNTALFLLLSLISAPAHAGQPLQAPDGKNQPTISLGKISSGHLTQKVEDLRKKIQGAISDAGQNETYLNLKDLTEKISAPNYVDSEAQKANREASRRAGDITKMAASLKQSIAQTNARSDALQKMLTQSGHLPGELTFGEEKTKKTASQVLKDSIFTNPSSLVKKIETEAKSYAASLKSAVPPQKNAWDGYLDKLRKEAADLNEKTFTSIESQFKNLKLPAFKALPQPPPNGAAQTLLNAYQTMNFFVSNWPYWELETEIVRINIQRAQARGGLESGAKYMNRELQQIDNLTHYTVRGLAVLSETFAFLEKIPKEKLSSQMKKTIQDISDSYSKLKEDFPKKRQMMIEHQKQFRRIDGYQSILDQLEPYRDQLIKRLKDLEAGNPASPFPTRPNLLLTTEGDGWFKLPSVVVSTPPALEPFDSLLSKMSGLSGSLRLRLAFQLGIYTREGAVRFEDIRKGSLAQKSLPADWPSPDFVIKDMSTAERIWKSGKLGTLPDFYPGRNTPDRDDFRPSDVWIVSTGISTVNSITEMTIKDGKLIVTITDDPKNKPANRVPLHIIKINDPEIAAAILGGAAVEFVHVPA